MQLCRYLGVQHPRYLKLSAGDLVDWMEHFNDTGDKPRATWKEYDELRERSRQILKRRKERVGW